MPCALNAAQEAALDAFIAGQIGFLDMAGLVEDTLSALGNHGDVTSLDDVLNSDAAARTTARRLVERKLTLPVN